MDWWVKYRKYVMAGAVTIGALVVLIVGAVYFVNRPAYIYTKAAEQFDNKRYESAWKTALRLDDSYNDARYLKQYYEAYYYYNAPRRQKEAADVFERLSTNGVNYKNSAEMAAESLYQYATAELSIAGIYSLNRFDNALVAFNKLGVYKDAQEQAEAIPGKILAVEEAAEKSKREADEKARADAATELENEIYKSGLEREDYFAQQEKQAAEQAVLDAESKRADAQQELERKSEDSIKKAKKAIVGTWLRGDMQAYKTYYPTSYSPTDLGDTLIFAKDGTIERRSGNFVQTAKYFFEDCYLIIREPALLGGETDSKYLIFMDENDKMSLKTPDVYSSSVFGDSNIVYYATPYSRK